MSTTVTYYRGNGVKLFNVENISYLRYTRTANRIGTLTIRFISEPKEIFFNDYFIIYRDGINDSRTIWLVNKVTYLPFEKEYTIECVDANYILSTRIVAYASGTSEATKTDFAGDMIYEIIEENFLAPTDSDRTAAFETGTSNNLGPVVSKSFARKSVLTTLQDICSDVALSTQTPLYFDMSYTSALTFRVYLDQIGSVNNLRLGIDRGNIEALTAIDDYSSLATVAYVGGQNTGVNRTIAEVESSIRTPSLFNRVETFRNATQYETLGGLTNEGRNILYDKRPRKTIEVLLSNIPGSEYNKDWSFGDKVIVEYLGVDYQANIDAVQVMVFPTSEYIKAYLVINL